MNNTHIIGTSWHYMAVLFDLAKLELGSEKFLIYKNIETDDKPNIRFGKENYNYEIYSLAEFNPQKNDKILFGVTGPFGKHAVFEDFSSQKSLKKNELTNLIHSSTVLAESVKLVGTGITIDALCVVSSQTSIGFGVSVKRSVSIGHHCNIGHYVEINPGVTISGSVSIGQGTIIGSGASVMDRITIGSNTVVGMGSVVTRDIPDNVIAYGNPCKVIRENPRRIPVQNSIQEE